MDNFLRILQFVKPYKKKVILTIGTTIVITLFGLLIPLIVRYIVDEVIQKQNWSVFSASIPLPILLILVLSVLAAILSFPNNFIIVYLSKKIVFDIRLAVYKHIQKLSLRFYQENPTGKIMSRVMGDTQIVSNVFTHSTIQMIVNIASVIFAIGIMIHINWKLTLVMVAFLSLYVLNYRYFLPKIKSKQSFRRSRMDQVSSGLVEVLSEQKTVKSFAQEKRETKVFTHRLHNALNIGLQGVGYSATFSFFSSLVNGLGKSTIYCLGCYFVIKGEMTYGDVLALSAYAVRIFTPALKFSEISNTMAITTISLRRIFEILNTPIEIKDASDAVAVEKFRGEIHFNNISFEYETGNPVIKNIDFTIPVGKTVALVGETGCGKTTMASLLLRFYDVKSGSITIDGMDIRKIRLNCLHKRIGVVPQDSFVFNATIRENISYGRKGVSDKEIKEAARIAEIANFIESLAEGYETMVGVDGIKFSAGEKQRLTIARTIVTNPDILIMDEATSNLDTESEKLIQRALERIMAARTSLVIAHRLSTIVNADVIVVMDKGRIVESGSHQELIIRKESIYHKLCEQQKAIAQAKSKVLW
ncbi:ABC transporter ATP-binding protein [bacterium]|nr:ABC transporter ATP-binding protein [bacterium]